MANRILFGFTCFAFLIWVLNPSASFGQAADPASSPITEIDTYVKVVGAVLTGLATLFGLPIVFLTYRKTRAEIAKLDLEAAALREKLPPPAKRTDHDEGGIRVNVEHSPNVHVQVLADPRFLAPLLLLLDFIFAWIVLTLAGYLLSIFGLGTFRTLALALLAAVLLMPIAKQVLRTRAVLRPPHSPEERRASIRQAKLAAYTVYALMILSSFAFGGLLLGADTGNLTDLGRNLAWGLITLSAALVLGSPILKPRVDRYLASLLNSAGD
jgi:hypothetical protein